MCAKSIHSQFSQELANFLEEALRDGEAGTWEDLNVYQAIDGHPGYGIDVWGEIGRKDEKRISISLCEIVAPTGLRGSSKVLFTASAPLDEHYEAFMDVTDKVLAHFERSFEAPLAPLRPGSPYGYFSREVMQPLLDALNAGDFEKAASLTPAKYRLCGYQEFAEEHVHEQYGHGWAGQFEVTKVPAGRYPVFAENYFYVENEMLYSNQLKDFQGLSVYLAGQCVADSDSRPDAFPYDNTVWYSPYCHAVAYSILEGKSSIQLLPEYQAVPVHFTSSLDGEEHTTYKIVDTTLPERMKQNPMGLRNQNGYIHKTLELSPGAKTLYNTFTSEFSHFVLGWGKDHLSFGTLMDRGEWSAPRMQELLDKELVQIKEFGPYGNYELTAKERMNLFITGQVYGAEKEALRWQREFDRCKKEVEQKGSLDHKIESAASRASEQKKASDVPAKNIPDIVSGR